MISESTTSFSADCLTPKWQEKEKGSDDRYRKEWTVSVVEETTTSHHGAK
jgi:hypothetical protein